MRRRDFLGAFGGAAVTWPLAARAQQPAMPVVGFVNGQNPIAFAHLVESFRKGLRETGYVEGQNVAIKYAWADGQDDQIRALIDDMVRRQVAVLVISGSGQGPLAAKTTPATLPVVAAMGSDPVELGIVASINRPGGHITGTMVLTSTMEAKRLDLLHQLLPKAELVAALVDPTFPGLAQQVAGLQTAAEARGFHIRIFHASTENELDIAFAALSEAKPSALIIVGNPFFNSERSQLVALSARYAMPSMFEVREFAVVGGLMSYGPSIVEIYRQLGVYAARILKGEKAGDLPVLQPTKFELVINLKTAKALGLSVPLTLQVAADEVIE